MNRPEKIIASLKQKELLDESSINRLSNRLKLKLQEEAKANEKEMTVLKAELTMLRMQLVN